MESTLSSEPLLAIGNGSAWVKSAGLRAGQSLSVYCEKLAIPEPCWTRVRASCGITLRSKWRLYSITSSACARTKCGLAVSEISLGKGGKRSIVLSVVIRSTRAPMFVAAAERSRGADCRSWRLTDCQLALIDVKDAHGGAEIVSVGDRHLRAQTCP